MKEMTVTEEKGATLVPACSIREENGSIIIRLEMPGVAKENLKISMEANELAILGSTPPDNREGAYLVRERRTGDYRKAFTIDDSIDREKVDATLSNGIATIKLQVKEAIKPRLIEIR
jgi:HSP20 family protein